MTPRHKATIAFQEQELCKQATRIALWGKSRRAHRVFDKAKAVWLFKIGHYGLPRRLSL